MENKKAIKAIFIVAVIGLVVCVAIIGGYYIRQTKQLEKYEELANSVNQQMEDQAEFETDIDNIEETTEAVTEVVEEAVDAAMAAGIDFEQLKGEVNEHIYAWVKIDGTTVDYPILQHPSDNTYYLNHNLDNSYGYPGCVYTELYNTTTFDDPVTVMYGHNMKNGSMFGALHQFEDKEFFDSHDTVTVYMPGTALNYKIVAACKIGNQRLTTCFDFNNKEVLKQFANDIVNLEENKTNHVRKDIEVTENDKFIILETCVSGEKTNRYIIFAVQK